MSLISTSRALSLYRSLLRAARALPSQQDRESLEQETKQRFRAERERRRGGSEAGGGEGDEGALFDEAEARLHDARHHGIPHARLEHAAQIPVAVLESARRLGAGGGGGGGAGGGGITLPRDKSARAKLEAALERRRIKKQLEEREQKRND